MTETLLDKAHKAMEAAPESDLDRLQYFGAFASAELFLLLEKEAAGEQIEPQVFDTEDGKFVLAFDREDRLADFAQGSSAYVAVSGRSLASTLCASGIGVILNAGFPSSYAIGSSDVAWLNGMISTRPVDKKITPVEVLRPKAPKQLLAALDRRLASASGLAECAYLIDARFDDNSQSTLLTFIGAANGAAEALTLLAQEALTFSGTSNITLDVGFFERDDPILAQLEKFGLRFDLPQPETPTPPKPPGLDPKSPPKLR